MPTTKQSLQPHLKVRRLGMRCWNLMRCLISGSLDSYIVSFHTQKNAKFVNLSCLACFNSNLLMFCLPGLCCKTSVYPGSSLTPQEQHLEKSQRLCPRLKSSVLSAEKIEFSAFILYISLSHRTTVRAGRLGWIGTLQPVQRHSHSRECVL